LDARTLGATITVRAQLSEDLLGLLAERFQLFGRGTLAEVRLVEDIVRLREQLAQGRPAALHASLSA
jgi:hypothetical protein